MARKRAPGGGRKPAGKYKAKTAAFGTRITQETRNALEDEARRTGESISQAAERLLRTALLRSDDPALRALSFLVAETANAIVGVWNRDGRLALNWRTDPFTCEALKLAIPLVIDQLRPAGEVRPPTETVESLKLIPPAEAETYRTPQERAKVAAMFVGMKLRTYEPFNKEIAARAALFSPQFQSERYGMVQARRDLGIPDPEKSS